MDYQVTSKKNPFVTAAMIFGIMSILTISTIFLPIPLAALALLFAALAHRKGEKLKIPCLTGLICSIISLTLSLSILVTAVAMIPSLLKDKEYRKQLNAISEQIYGESFDGMIEDIYGVDLENIFETE